MVNAKAGILWLEKFDEAIAELEEAMKPSSCDGCVGNGKKHYNG